MSESIGETGRDHCNADRARERETGEWNRRGVERESGDKREEERGGKRVRRTHGTYMRLGNALIGLSDGFRVAPYRWDRSRFDKIEFHLESAVTRVCLLLHTGDILFSTLSVIVPDSFFISFTRGYACRHQL